MTESGTVLGRSGGPKTKPAPAGKIVLRVPKGLAGLDEPAKRPVRTTGVPGRQVR